MEGRRSEVVGMLRSEELKGGFGRGMGHWGVWRKYKQQQSNPPKDMWGDDWGVKLKEKLAGKIKPSDFQTVAAVSMTGVTLLPNVLGLPRSSSSLALETCV